jgi:hypothetical protein
MDAIVQAILNLSKLEVSLIRITEPENDAFLMEIESKVTNTGPLGATQLPMTVELVGPKGIFGLLELPEVKTKSAGTDVYIKPQHIKITDQDAFQAFVKSLQLDDKLILKLDNGKGQIKALMMKANITYRKEVALLGMQGPKTTIVKTEDLGDGKFKNTLKITNPSPLEIDIGENTFHYIDEAGTVIAEQYGSINIPRGDSYHEVTGVVKAKNPQGKVRLVGADVAKDSWLKETIKYFDTPITLTPELIKLTSE